MVPNDLKYIQASLSLILTDWLRLRAAQMPRCRDMAIFMVTTTDRQTDYFTPVHPRGVTTLKEGSLTLAKSSNLSLPFYGDSLYHSFAQMVSSRLVVLHGQENCQLSPS